MPSLTSKCYTRNWTPNLLIPSQVASDLSQEKKKKKEREALGKQVATFKITHWVLVRSIARWKKGTTSILYTTKARFLTGELTRNLLNLTGSTPRGTSRKREIIACTRCKWTRANPKANARWTARNRELVKYKGSVACYPPWDLRGANCTWCRHHGGQENRPFQPFTSSSWKRIRLFLNCQKCPAMIQHLPEK